MIERPQFRATYAVEVVEPDGVFLLSERGHLLLHGELHCELAPLLDGRRTVDEIVDELCDRVSPAKVYYALALLEEKGYVVEADASGAPDRVAYWDGLGTVASEAERRIADTAIEVRALGGTDAEVFTDAFAAAGFVTREVATPGALIVAIVDDYLDPRLDALNAEALAHGRAWMMVKATGTVMWVGPVFEAGAGPCWACLAHRLRANREVESFLEARRGEALRVPAGIHPVSLRLSAGLAAALCVKIVGAADDSDADPVIITFDTASMGTEEHPVLRRPQCPACGRGPADPARPPVPVALEHRRKTFTEDGGHRGATPRETLARYERHVSRISGVVRTLVEMPADDEGMLPVFVAGHNEAWQFEDVGQLRNGIRSNAGGKGVTVNQARASALCEALERFSGNFQGDEARVRGSLRSLGDQAIHPNACMLFSEAQYEARRAWNSRGSRFERVPERFEPDAEVDWTAVWSLTANEHRYLPTAYCYYGVPDAPRPYQCLPDSNGNASGNSLEEAILQGFLELVERDGVALWWYPRARRPAVDLASFADPAIATMRDRYRRMGRELWVLDVTSDLGIPTFVAVSRATTGPERIVIGFGAHFDPTIGVLRAITEASQSLTVLRGFEQDPSAYDPPTRRWWETATVGNQPYLVPSGAEPIPLEAYDAHWSDDVLDDVLRCQAVAEQAGLELLVLDQTRPDVGLPVAKVFVPGLRHFWTRFAPGRLYDVPITLGWVEQRPNELNLNPVGMFM